MLPLLPPCLSESQKRHWGLIAHNKAETAEESCPVQINVFSSYIRHSPLAQNILFGPCAHAATQGLQGMCGDM